MDYFGFVLRYCTYYRCQYVDKLYMIMDRLNIATHQFTYYFCAHRYLSQSGSYSYDNIIMLFNIYHYLME